MIDIKKKWGTRSGLDVCLVSDKGHPDWPIVGFIGNGQQPYSWKQDGSYHEIRGESHDFDLVEVKEKKVMYVNVYEDGSICGYESQNGAWKDRQQKNGRISCIRVEYEEGQFDE